LQSVRMRSVSYTALLLVASLVVAQAAYTCRCGLRNRPRGTRIVGGTEAGPHEFPWQVGIVGSWYGQLAQEPNCGGTLISSTYVLTAAHCLTAPIPGWAVMYGTNQFKTRGVKSVQVKRIIRNTPLGDWNPATDENDIALLELASPITFSPEVSPACLPEADTDYTGKMATVSGWGRLEHEGAKPGHLRQVSLMVGEDSYCGAKWGNRFKKQVMMCTDVTPGKDSCRGDSGGPLVVKTGYNYDLAGVVSFGRTCADEYPGVYTRVQAYLAWLHEYVGTDGDHTCPRGRRPFDWGV